MQKVILGMDRQGDAISELEKLLRENVFQWETSAELSSEFSERVISLILTHPQLEEAIGHQVHGNR